ncbi:MAG: DUF4157 domain-containing protein, partial [Roseofilum sp. SBFL]
KAFTTGQDVFFKRGAYNPGSQGGQELIAHELTHVMQQGGANPQTAQRKPANRSQSPEQVQTRVRSSSSPVVQRYANFTSQLNGLEPAPKNDVDPHSAKRDALTALQGYLGSQNGAIVVKGSGDRFAWASEQIIEHSNEQLEAGGSFVTLKQGNVFSKQSHLNTAYNQELPNLYEIKPIWNPREEAQSKDNVHYRTQQQNLGNPVPAPKEEKQIDDNDENHENVAPQNGSDMAPLAPLAPLAPTAPMPNNGLPQQQEIRHVELNEQSIINSTLELWKDCRKSSGAVMGSQLEREIRYDTSPPDEKQQEDLTPKIIKKYKSDMPELMLSKINFDLLKAWFKTYPRPNQEQAKKMVQRLMPPVKPEKEDQKSYDKRLRKWKRRNKNKISADDVYFGLDDEEQDQFNEHHGMGKYALPDVGEGYVIISGQRATGFDTHHKYADKGKAYIFPYHWGGVVAQDGNDRLTLEAASEGDEHAIKEGWTFELYGTEEGQSFHEKHAATGRYGNMHQTLRVYKPTERNKQNQLDVPVMGGGGLAPIAPVPGIPAPMAPVPGNNDNLPRVAPMPKPPMAPKNEQE